MHIQILLLITLLGNVVRSEDLECDLVNNQTTAITNSFICNLYTLSKIDKTRQVRVSSSSNFPMRIDKETGDINWSHSYQPSSARWSLLCDTRSQFCTNSCDLDGFCLVKIEVNEKSLIKIKFKDNLKYDWPGPKLSEEPRLFNITVDLANLDNEITLIESTKSLDPFRSKPNRVLNEFSIEGTIDTSLCKSNLEPTNNIFSIRHDLNDEKLFLKVENRTGLESLECLVLRLSVGRSIGHRSTSMLLINVIDNRLDRPVFDFNVYNFTITENLRFDAIIGQIRASYARQFDPEIKYRIVPMITEAEDNTPVRIDYNDGKILPRSNIDREKYLRLEQLGDNNQNGLLQLNVESSYAGILYSYCRVNIFIRDVNDNEPKAKLRILPAFKVSNYSNTNEIRVMKQTPVNSILAYLAVFDPDAGENGTVKSIELNLLSSRQASLSVSKQRSAKLASLSRPPQIAKFNQRLQTPFKVQKIGDKMYAIQLITKMDFKQVESFMVEIRIQDNGTSPMMESRTLLNLNAVDENDYAPEFVKGNVVQVDIDEESLSGQVIHTATAVDLDDGDNGVVRYTFGKNPYVQKLKVLRNDLNEVGLVNEANRIFEETFELNQDTGAIRLKRGLDFEGVDGDSIELQIYATDRADSPKNSSCIVRIRIADQNDNVPTFTQSHYNLIASSSDASFVSPIGSFLIVDPDTYYTNSRTYTHSSKLPFLFNDEKCQRSLSLNLTESSSNPFLFLVESHLFDQRIICKATIFADTAALTKSFYQFALSVSDHGRKKLNRRNENATFSIFVTNETLFNRHEQIQFTNSSYLLETSLKPSISSVVKMNKNNEQIYVDSKHFRINEEKPFPKINIESDIETGFYLIDLNLMDARGRSVWKQVEVSFSNETRQIESLESKLTKAIARSQFASDADLSSFVYFQRLLFSNPHVAVSAASSNLTITTILFTRPSSFIQFVVLSAGVLCVVLVLFICCVCMVVRKNCRELKRKSKSDSTDAKKVRF